MSDNTVLSACMMVKNEEEMLPRCLESIRHLVDEIVVVDTGSEDQTVRIAKSYGAKVFHHPWENDFSKHRNQSIEYATGDWFLIIDADEELQSAKLTRKSLVSRLQAVDTKVHALTTTVVDYKQDGSENVRLKNPRIFRNNAGIRYKGIVHNQAHFMGKIVDTDLVIQHYGYDLSPEKMEAKFHRTTALLKKRIEENPQDFDAYYYLANSYGKHKLYDQAVRYAKKSLECLPEDGYNKIYDTNYFTIAISYIFREQYAQALEWTRMGLERTPEDTGLLYILTTALLALNRPEELEEAALKYVDAHAALQSAPASQGLRFIYHYSEADYQTVIYRLLTAQLMLGKHDSLYQWWEECRSLIIADETLQRQLLHNIGVSGAYALFQKIIPEFIHSTEYNRETLESITRLIADAPNALTPESIRKITMAAPDTAAGAQSIEFIVFHLYQEGRVELARLIVREFGLSNIEGAAFLQTAADVLKNSDEISEATALTHRLVNSSPRDADLRLFAIRFFFDIHDAESLLEQLSAYTELVSSYEDIPADVLLILCKYLVEDQRLDTALEVTDVLARQNYPEFDREIKTLSDLAVFYTGLAGVFRHAENYPAQKISYEIAYLFNGELSLIEKIGDLQFKLGNYAQSIQYYNQLLQADYEEAEFLPRMKTAFQQTGNAQGVELCDQLLVQR